MNMSKGIYAIRRQNLRYLTFKYCQGKNKLLAEKLERSGSYAGQLLNSWSNIGDKVARHIEQAFQLPQFSLDTLIDDDMASSTLSRTLAEAEPPTQRLVWYLLGGDDLEDLPPSARAAIKAQAEAIKALLCASESHSPAS